MRPSPLRLRVLTCLVVVALPACGGGGGANVGTSPPPAPAPSPAPGDPCAAAAAAPGNDSPLGGQYESVAAAERPAAHGKQRPSLDRDPRGTLTTALYAHAAARERGLFQGPVNAATEDIGEIAVLQDGGDLIIPPNRFDLRGAVLRFTRVGSAYDVSRTDGGLRSPVGGRVRLEDDDTTGVDLAFAFPYFGRSHSRAFVNSDGNITFEEPDTASTERNLSRVLTGPPRVAPFFADLDPSTGNGRMFVDSSADAFTVTWCNVRGFDLPDTVTAQATLLPDGTIEMRYGATGLTDAIVAVAPGRAGRFVPVDLSAASAAGSPGSAIGERFAAQLELDLVAVARKFYESHPDSYDQLVIWTDTRLTRDAFAFETTVSNEIRGVGLPIFDQAGTFGSAGRLRSMVMMDSLGKYPSDPSARVLGENSTLSLVGHEVGHRWLAFLEFRDANGRASEALLGRDAAHWSFFMDSDASVMEGNDIEDLGGGRFRTVAAVEGYSLLDQYAMGLVSESQVPPFFYVEAPVNVQPSRDAESAPDIGVTFNGTRRDVLIQDVVAVMGPRQPSSREAPRTHRQAFVYVLSNGRSPDRGQVDKLDRIRRDWEPYFSRAVSGRARVETRLRPPS